MAKKESTQHKLDRVRAPRVHITYDVDIGDAQEKKELPFVVGVLGDFSGNPWSRCPSSRIASSSSSIATTSTASLKASSRAWRIASTTPWPRTVLSLASN